LLLLLSNLNYLRRCFQIDSEAPSDIVEGVDGPFLTAVPAMVESSKTKMPPMIMTWTKGVQFLLGATAVGTLTARSIG